MGSCVVAHRVVKFYDGVPGVVPLWQSDHQNVLHVFTGCGVAVVHSAGGWEDGRMGGCDVLPVDFNVLHSHGTLSGRGQGHLLVNVDENVNHVLGRAWYQTLHIGNNVGASAHD